MKKLRLNLVFITVLFFVSLYSNTIASTSSNFINEITNKTSNILSSKDTKEIKIQKLVKIGENSVDIDGIGFYTLGRYRKNLNDDQKN